MKGVSVLVSSVVLAATFLSAARALEPAEADVPLRPEKVPVPTIDGRLDDAAWETATRVELRDAATVEVPKRRTTVRLLWDAEALYIAFECEDDPKPNARLTVRDTNLWEEEVVEVFIDADDDQHSYIELEINPRNTLFDAFVLNRNKKHWLMRDWTMEGIEHAVAFDANGWTVEMRLPMREFSEAPHIPPKVGDVWRVNLYRIDRSEDPNRPEMTSWSPIGRYDFHESDAFGRLRFVASP